MTNQRMRFATCLIFHGFTALVLLSCCTRPTNSSYDGEGELIIREIWFPTHELILPPFDITEDGVHRFKVTGLPTEKYYFELDWDGSGAETAKDAFALISEADPYVHVTFEALDATPLLVESGMLLNDWKVYGLRRGGMEFGLDSSAIQMESGAVYDLVIEVRTEHNLAAGVFLRAQFRGGGIGLEE